MISFLRLLSVFSLCSLFIGCTATTPAPVYSLEKDYNSIERGSYRGRYYEVQKGDTLYFIAYVTNKDVKELIAYNNLSAPYTIHPGDKIRLWAPADAVPVYNASARTVAVTPANSGYSVNRTVTTATTTSVPKTVTTVPKTTASVPKTTTATTVPKTTTTTAVAATTKAATTTAVAATTTKAVATTAVATTTAAKSTVNDKSTASSNSVTKVSPATSTNAISTNTSVDEPAVNSEPSTTASVSNATSDNTTSDNATSDNATSNNKVSKWLWPTKGRVIKHFSNGEQGNKGIDMAGQRGQPIISTAAGTVVYSGNALRGYGNLIIIKHNDDYLSAYAHNDQLLVTEGKEVSAGQKIATMGSTGTNSVKLHFEIRYQGKSVNPSRYLP